MDGKNYDPEHGGAAAPESHPGGSGGAAGPDGELNVILRGGNPAYQGLETPEGEPQVGGVQPPSAPQPPPLGEQERIRLSLQRAEEDGDVAPGFYAASPAPGGGKLLWIGLGAAVLIGAGIFIFSTFNNSSNTGETGVSGAATGGPPAADAMPMSERAGAVSREPAGALNAVAIDAAFMDSLVASAVSANEKWKAAGSVNYVYRVSATELTVPATSQQVNLTCFVGGENAQAALKGEAAEGFIAAMQPYLDNLNERAGVTALLGLLPLDPEALPLSTDRYISYGYDYGLEHKRELDEVIGYLEGFNRDNGRYPLSLKEVGANVKTKGNLMYESGGFGYLPSFKTDSSGNIMMGSGKGLDSYQPEATTGYYLFRFLIDPTTGLDVYGAADINYYRDKISSFPYRPRGPIQNVGLNPDGKPDGIGCVVRNGEIQR